MAISYNTGATADSGGTQATSQAITIPAGVHAGDVVLILAQQVPLTSTPSTFTAASTGTTPTSAGSPVTGTEPLPAAVTGQVFWFAASASDAGKVVTITASATGFWSLALVAYAGVSNSSPIDVISGAFGGASSGTVTCPTVPTVHASDWAVFLGGGAGENATALTPPSGSTLRQSDDSSSQIEAVISDSNGSVGAAGTNIGGGTFTSPTSTNSILTAFTVGLAQATAGSVAPTPPRIPHPRFLDILLRGSWERADWQAQGVADLTVAFSSTSGGVDTYNVTSPWDSYGGAGAQQMRVLNPTAPNANYPHAFLIMLPVDPNQGTTFGDSIGIAQSIGAHNTYNLTCVQPGYAPAGPSGTGPWFGDNPLDPTISQEKYTLLVVNWIRQHLATTGTEKVYLIGFSRSGLAAQFLQFRHPYLFSAIASWDTPYGMTDYNGADPNGTVGGNSADVFGTSASFQTNYQLSAAHLGAWQATGQYGVNRIWIGQGPAFTDFAGYQSALTAAGIPYTGTFSNTVESHAWQTDWVAAALASIIPSNWAHATTVLPQQIPHPLYLQLADVAAYRLRSAPLAVSTSATGNAQLATGTGTAQPPVVAITAFAGLAAGTGTAQPPVPAVTANAGLATGTGTAQPPVPVVTAFAGLATGTGAALQPTVSTSGNTTANAGLATGTGAALQPVIAITVFPGLAAGTGAALAPVPAVTATSGLATGAGTAQPPVPVVIANAGLATGTGAALQPSVSTSGNTTANAGLASGTGTAQAPAAQVTAFAGLATAAGAALNGQRIIPAGLAAGTGAAQAPALTVLAQAQAATALGAALNATGKVIAPFTVGTLTAADSRGAGGTLTASDQRTGGPG